MTTDAAAADRFPRPPLSFVDAADRAVEVEALDDPGGEADALVDMYADFAAADRAQGLPPRTEPRIRDWIERLLDEGRNVVARHGDRTVGHAALLPYEDTSELVIFVHPDYQEAGIGSRLIRALLGHGQETGIAHVWLSVQQDNHVARSLYRSVGFETVESHEIEYEMELDLLPAEE
ncbi:GNAT family N-acetyltransferase [Halomicrobium salinisoli]|uniref:GNAT family N-acetyltransferase n=1 Tax=Halomicrobium salinisoli TaxID=2878391 RepID=UPI001CEFFC8C|nr:GNAT family N-acetyltransferase [Halomicrobium salinisoli]